MADDVLLTATVIADLRARLVLAEQTRDRAQAEANRQLERARALQAELEARGPVGLCPMCGADSWRCGVCGRTWRQP